MPSPSKSWNPTDRVAFINAYTNLRRLGKGRLESRMQAQDVLDPKKRYSQSSVNKMAVNPGVKDIMTDAETHFLSGKAPMSTALPVNMDQTKPDTDEDIHETSPETYMVLLFRAMRAETERIIDARLSKVAELLTDPTKTREDVENEIVSSMTKKDERPKLVVIGLKGVQPSIVEAAIGNRYKTKYVRSEHATSAGTRESVKNADLVVTMKDFVGHDSENIVSKYVKDGAGMITHAGGVKMLIERLNNA